MENATGEEYLHAEVGGPTKPVRHRKKMFYRTLRHQMEFYFSDANINKNRFMGQHLMKDPQVELTLFLSFNKIREMTDDVNDIAKSLRKSKMLSITEDGLKVFRTTEICQGKKEDACTIYVEHLPADAEHEWLRGVFLPYGGVPYVSIPKFNLSKMNKGFAFVEFDTADGAARALEAFAAMGCRLSSQVSPEEIASNLVQEERLSNELGSNEADDDPDRNLFKKPIAKVDMFQDYTKKRYVEKVKEVETDTEHKGTKRKLGDEESTAPEELRKKKAKSETSDVDEDVVEDCDVADVKVVEEQMEGRGRGPEDGGGEQENDEKENEGEEEEEEEEDEDGGKRRKSRKHKKKKNKASEHRVDPKLALRVMSKPEWKVLRNRYVSLQKSKMKALKHRLACARWAENYVPRPSQRDRKPPAPAPASAPADKPAKVFAFVPGAVVRVHFKEPAVDVKAFKAVARMHKDVAYVDIAEGATEAFVRCATADAAARLIKEKPWTEMDLVEGDAEKDYWEKITRDRDQKVKGNVANLVKRRGRDKLLKKAEKALGKHIRFDDPE